MKNNDTIYNIFVHIINWLLLGVLGVVTFFLMVNISPAPIDSFHGVKAGYVITMALLWALNYWYQYHKKRKWFLPIVGAILFVGIGMLLGGIVVPYLYYLIYT